MFLPWKEERVPEREKKKTKCHTKYRKSEKDDDRDKNQFRLGSLKVLYRDSMQGEGEASHDAEVRRQLHNKQVCDYSSVGRVLA